MACQREAAPRANQPQQQTARNNDVSVAPAAPPTPTTSIAKDPNAEATLAWGSDANWPTDFTADATDLYWATARDIRSMPKKGGPVRILLAQGLGIFNELTLSKDQIVYSTRGRMHHEVGMIPKHPPAASLPVPLILAREVRYDGIAVDDTHAYFCGDELMRVPLAGNQAPSEKIGAPPNCYKFVVDQTELFVVAKDGLHKMTRETKASAWSKPISIAKMDTIGRLLTDAQSVYFVGREKEGARTFLYRLPRSTKGNVKPEVITSDVDSPLAFLDATSVLATRGTAILRVELNQPATTTRVLDEGWGGTRTAVVDSDRVYYASNGAIRAISRNSSLTTLGDAPPLEMCPPPVKVQPSKAAQDVLGIWNLTSGLKITRDTVMVDDENSLYLATNNALLAVDKRSVLTTTEAMVKAEADAINTVDNRPATVPPALSRMLTLDVVTSIAADHVESKVYYATKSALKVATKAAMEKPIELAKLESITGIAVGKTHLVVTVSADRQSGTVYRVPKTPGAQPTPIATNQPDAHTPIIDGDDVYWGLDAMGLVMRASLSSPDKPASPVGVGRDVSALAVDDKRVIFGGMGTFYVKEKTDPLGRISRGRWSVRDFGGDSGVKQLFLDSARHTAIVHSPSSAWGIFEDRLDGSCPKQISSKMLVRALVVNQKHIFVAGEDGLFAIER